MPPPIFARTAVDWLAVEHAFGREPDFALGIEEELLLVDPFDLQPDPRASALVAEAEPSDGEVTLDLYEVMIESATPVVRSAPEGVATLAALREELRGAGATLIG